MSAPRAELPRPLSWALALSVGTTLAIAALLTLRAHPLGVLTQVRVPDAPSVQPERLA